MTHSQETFADLTRYAREHHACVMAERKALEEQAHADFDARWPTSAEWMREDYAQAFAQIAGPAECSPYRFQRRI